MSSTVDSLNYEMDLFHCMQFIDSHSEISACMGGTERARDSQLGTCLARQLHAEIDRLHECMSDSANLSGAAVFPGVPGIRRGTVQPLSPPDS